MPRLTFDADSHTYLLDGRIIPGITAMLRAVGLLDKVARVPEVYRERGHYVHLWVEAYLLGRVRPETPIPPLVQPYLAALQRALRELDPGILAVEELVWNPAGPYATKLDIRCRWRQEVWCWNLKTGGRWPWYPVQTALEALCCPKPPRRACLYITKHGTYRVEVHDNPRDYVQARWVIAEYKRRIAAERSA